jgi:hypothetical protein
MIRKLGSTVVLAILCCFFLVNSSSAQQTKKPTGITISPAFAQVQVSATETEHPIRLKVTNNEDKPQTLEISAADFNTLDESGGLLFVGTNPTELQKKYGLAKWIRLPETSITLEPKETKNIDAIIVNEPDFAPGGHYGALMLSLPSSSLDEKQNKVAINSIASSLLFVTKTGGEIYKLQLNKVEDSHNIFKLPNSVTLRFKNNGNTHLTPRGVVTIIDPSGKVVKKGVINQDSNIILPEAFRRYTVDLNNISTARLPGKYKTVVDFRFDGYEKFRTYQTSQFLLTPNVVFLIVPIIVILAAISALYLSKNRSYKLAFLKSKKDRRKSK